MLQEASGAAGHPSYRRYHYGSGPLLVEDGGTRRFISTDALGSTTDLTTTGATVASMRKYDAWGQYRNDTAPQATESKLGFTGHQYDPETGLVYARARYYDPEMGRFLSRDPVDLPPNGAPNLHRFVYAANNPLIHTDPNGEILPFLAFIALAGIIGGEASFITQEIENQATSVSQAVERTDWTRVAKTAGTATAVAAAGYGGAVVGGGLLGTAGQAGAAAVGLGEFGTAAVTGAATVFGAGVGGDLAAQGAQVALGERERIDVGRAVTVGAVLAPFGAAAGVVRQASAGLAADVAEAAAKGMQEGAAEAAGARAAAPGVARVAASTEVAIVEAAARPGTVQASSVPPAQAGQAEAALAQERERLVRLLHKRELGLDPAKGFLPQEAETAAKVEVTAGRLARHRTPEYDWVDARGSTYDAVGPVPREHFDADSFLKQLSRHLTRKQGLDKVVVDLTGLDAAHVRQVESYLSGLGSVERGRVVIVR